MKRLFGTFAQFEARAANRPPGYVADVLAAVLEKTDAGWWFDADHPALKKYARRQLAGDRIERLAKIFGMDRLMKSLERVTGKGCRCQARRQWLNRLHARVMGRR